MAEDYVVKEGDCLQSIAKKRGFLSDTLWQHAKNSELKRVRKNPGTLYPGDTLHIPDLGEKKESGGTETRHRFRMRCEKAELRLKLLKEAEPSDDLIEDEGAGFSEYIEAPAQADPPEVEADVECSVYVDGDLAGKEKTDGEGCLVIPIPQDAGYAKLVIDEGKENERTVELNLGHMDPIDELQGACKRLYNLGYQCPTDSNTYSEQIGFAIQSFQKDQALDATGRMDDPTKARLEKVFGS